MAASTTGSRNYFLQGGGSRRKGTIQHQFGQAVLDSVIDFCRHDIRTVNEFKSDEFSHISDPDLGRTLSKTMYGARWLCKVGMTMLASGD